MSIFNHKGLKEGAQRARRVKNILVLHFFWACFVATFVCLVVNLLIKYEF
jgi:hypothetical protein